MLASQEIQQRVRDMQEESAIELSNQSKERALVWDEGRTDYSLSRPVGA